MPFLHEAAYALMESFGCDGDPGSYTDIDACDTLFLVGHNVAETQTVLWMRMLDRLHGPDRPKLVVVDPRPTPAARAADVWLPIRSGTNVALLNDQRGYQTYDITPKEWRTDVKVMDRVQSPGGKLDTLARFAVTPDKAELHRV